MTKKCNFKPHDKNIKKNYKNLCSFQNDTKLYCYLTNNKAMFVKAKWMRGNASQRWMEKDYSVSFERSTDGFNIFTNMSIQTNYQYPLIIVYRMQWYWVSLSDNSLRMRSTDRELAVFLPFERYQESFRIGKCRI